MHIAAIHEHMLAGYVRGAGDLVDKSLRAALATAPAYMTYMLALRFLIELQAPR